MLDATKVSSKRKTVEGIRHHAAKTEFNECFSKFFGVGQRWLHEHVEVLGESWLRVDRQGVPPD
jgi:hypothetical protein